MLPRRGTESATVRAMTAGDAATVVFGTGLCCEKVAAKADEAEKIKSRKVSARRVALARAPRAEFM
jgi:hypothetical protein